MTKKSVPPGKPHNPGTDDPVEKSNIGTGREQTEHDANRAAEQRAISEDRGKRIEHLERERDELARAKGPVKTKPHLDDLRVTGCDLLTAPEHVLVLRLTGEEQTLEHLKRRVLQSLVKLEDESADGVHVDPGRLPDELREVIQRLPA